MEEINIEQTIKTRPETVSCKTPPETSKYETEEKQTDVSTIEPYPSLWFGLDLDTPEKENELNRIEKEDMDNMETKVIGPSIIKNDAADDLCVFVCKWMHWVTTVPDFANKEKQINKQITFAHRRTENISFTNAHFQKNSVASVTNMFVLKI